MLDKRELLKTYCRVRVRVCACRGGWAEYSDVISFLFGKLLNLSLGIWVEKIIFSMTIYFLLSWVPPKLDRIRQTAKKGKTEKNINDEETTR